MKLHLFPEIPIGKSIGVGTLARTDWTTVHPDQCPQQYSKPLSGTFRRLPNKALVGRRERFNTSWSVVEAHVVRVIGYY